MGPNAAIGVSFRPGGLIMIHGQPNYFGWLAPLLQHFDWTNGCIAVTNAEMQEMWNLVPANTPIDIAHDRRQSSLSPR